MKNQPNAQSGASQTAIAAAKAKQANLSEMREKLAAINSRIAAIESGAEPAAEGAPPKLRETYQRVLAAHALGQATDREVGGAEQAWRAAELEAAARSSQQAPALDRTQQTLAGLNHLRDDVGAAIDTLQAEMPACLLAMYDAEADRISGLYIAAARELTTLFGQLWGLNRLAASQPGAREDRYHTSWEGATLTIPLFRTEAFSGSGYLHTPGVLFSEEHERRRGTFLALVEAERARFAEQGVFI